MNNRKLFIIFMFTDIIFYYYYYYHYYWYVIYFDMFVAVYVFQKSNCEWKNMYSHDCTCIEVDWYIITVMCRLA